MRSQLINKLNLKQLFDRFHSNLGIIYYLSMELSKHP